eukprot:2486179-Prorocentrum_lima.AAC.1
MERTNDYLQDFVLRLVCTPLQMTDGRHDVGSTHEEPSQCTQEAAIARVHLFGAEVVWVGDDDVLCVNLAKLKN